jgi:DNA polymerase (family X)
MESMMLVVLCKFEAQRYASGAISRAFLTLIINYSATFVVLMTNKQIAYAFDHLANLMELYEEDDFRVRSYRNAYLNLRKLDQPLADLTDADIKNIKGVGPAIAAKIRELLQGGQMAAVQKYEEKTPSGVVEMLDVNGFGPKKVRTVWKDMGIESVGELWYACHENRLVEYKGFGLKTQEDLKQKLEYFQRSQGKCHLDSALRIAESAAQVISRLLPGAEAVAVGELRRCCAVIEQVELLLAYDGDLGTLWEARDWTLLSREDGVCRFRLPDETEFTLYTCSVQGFARELFLRSGSEAFLKTFPIPDLAGLTDEAAVFERAGLPFIAPELREEIHLNLLTAGSQPPTLLTDSDIEGVLHVHTTWSDGLHTLREMCEEARRLGYAYIGITDHSQSAFYANGLKPDRVLAQMAEIDALNVEMAPFKIYKGIESDILNDGSLDYPDDLLAQFDFVIASVHSNLKMSREKATERVLKAIENPYTTILGHPTGRLLLSREGYPLDWPVILDACAKHGVCIELNANPRRLDIDWSLIAAATQRGIKIAINPDAHSKNGIQDIRYGVMVARKGGLTRADIGLLPLARRL